MIFNRHLRWLVLLFWAALPALAHVGTTTVFVQGNAGPYPVYVTVTPPAVVPGEAQVSVICDAADVRSMSAQANVLAGEASRYMPEGQALTPGPAAGPAGSHEFHGSVWIMTQGSWQIRLTVKGARGDGVLAVPLSASPTRLMRMSRPFGALLIALGVMLIAGLAALAAAFVREAQTEPGAEPAAANSRAGWRAGAIAVLGCGALLLIGNHLWRQEIARYSGNIYQPLRMQTTLAGGVLHLHLEPPSAAEEVFSSRRLDDLVLDHNHLMHLYLVRWPAMDVVFHLHPAQVAAGEFDVGLPSLRGGEYRLFADIVHADGFPETAVATLHFDASAGRDLTGDDAGGVVLPDLRLADGLRYRFAVESPVESPGGQATEIRAGQPVVLRFTLVDSAGQAPSGMQDYMGMAGHLAIIKDDGSVFAHIHPNGSAAMAAYMMANAAVPNGGAQMNMGAPQTNVAAFPFGFPSAGTYRLVVQMKHGGTVETGATDVVVR